MNGEWLYHQQNKIAKKAKYEYNKKREKRIQTNQQNNKNRLRLCTMHKIYFHFILDAQLIHFNAFAKDLKTHRHR